MSRNSSGTYSTPAGQPVVSGTVISSATFNTLVSDLAAEVTDSLSRSGKGGMTAPLRTADGTVAAPAHSFTSETGTGWYRAGASNPALAVAGTKRLEATSTGVVATGTLQSTGAATLNSAVVSTTLGVTGKTTLTGDLEVQGASVAITTGDVTLSQASSDQSILKSSGSLDIGTTDTNSLRLLSNNVARFTLVSGGNLESNGTATLTNLPTPSAASDAATKAYVDTGLIKAWALLTCGAAGAVTVTAGNNVASASWNLHDMTVTWTTAFTSGTSYVMVSDNATNGAPAQFVPHCPAGGSRSGASGHIISADFAGASRTWVSGDTVQVMAIGT